MRGRDIRTGGGLSPNKLTGTWNLLGTFILSPPLSSTVDGKISDVGQEQGPTLLAGAFAL